MRAIDLLEGTTTDTPWRSRETLPPSMTVPDLDPYYEYYRFLINIAGYPDKFYDKQLTQDVPVIVPYSPIEYQHTEELLRKMGKHPKFLTTKKSIEPDNTYTKSPVRPFEDLK